MDRRAALKTTTAAAIAVIAPAFLPASLAADAAGDGEVARLYQAWRTARDAYELAQDRLCTAEDTELLAPKGSAAKGMAAARLAVAEAEAKAAYDRVAPLVAKLSATAPSSAAGALAILEMLAVEFDGFEVPNLGRIVANLRPALAAA